MSALAVDIGTYSIKAISGHPGKKPKIEKTAEVFNSTGIAVPTDGAQIDSLSQLVEAMVEEHKFHRGNVRLSLPESVVSTKIITTPPLSDSELASAISWQAEQHIPIPKEELSLEYQVLYRPTRGSRDEQMRVLLVGARKTVVEQYVEIFNKLGFNPAVMETQMLSVVRSLQFTPTDATTLVSHIGASSSSLAVVRQGEIEFILSHSSGGQALTRALQQSVGLDAKQAEEYKRRFGLDESQFEGKIKQALMPGIDVLVGHLQQTIQFFANNHPNESVARVLLSGGTALLPHFSSLITAQLGVEVLTASPFANAVGNIPASDHPAFSVCMGLLLQEV